MQQLTASKLFYRLKNIDKDGSSNYSSIVAVSFNKVGAITTYPNPVKHQFFFDGNMGTSNSIRYQPLSRIRYVWLTEQPYIAGVVK